MSRLIDRLAEPADDLLRVLVQEAAPGIAIIDGGGIIVRVNDALRRMAAPSSDLSPGSSVLGLFPAARQTEIWAEIAPLQSGRARPRHFSITLAGGGTVEISQAILRETDGQVSGAILYLSDITAQSRLEAQLARGQKLQAVGQFTSGIAHDFNNLVMAMTGAADEILARGKLDPETEADLQQIRSSGERGASLVRQLLVFAAQLPSQRRTLLVNDAVTALAPLLVRLLGRTVALHLVLGEPGPRMRGDPAPFDQILVNLVVNAGKAMAAGGTVTIVTGAAALNGASAWDGTPIPQGRYAAIEVLDTGAGIAPEMLPRIFDPFFTTRAEQGGTGLGLSTVDAIVRQAEGFLIVNSVVGDGTRFQIYFPSHDEHPTLRTPHLPPGAGVTPCPVDKRAVLLVDDEEGLRLLGTRSLTQAGWHVIAADSGEAALASLTGDSGGLANLAIMIADVGLPGMSGPALVQAVRRLCPGLPAVLASGHLADTVREALDEEHTVFLSKPCSFKAMVAMVEEQAWPLSRASRR